MASQAKNALEASLYEERNLVSSGLRTILVYLQNDETLESRLQNALALARAHGAHADFLHVTPYEAYASIESLGGTVVTTDLTRLLKIQNDALRATVERRLRAEDVSWSYHEVTGSVVASIARYAALADLVVSSRAARSDRLVAPVGLLGDLISRLEAPLFITGEDGQIVDPTGIALIAWDGSLEAAAAVRRSLPLLTLASRVQLLSIREEQDDAFPSTRVLEFLSRHGIHADLRVEALETEGAYHEFIAATLMGRSSEMKAAYLVMGGYGHSRLGEFLLGGVTRTLLKDCSVPIVISR